MSLLISQLNWRVRRRLCSPAREDVIAFDVYPNPSGHSEHYWDFDIHFYHQLRIQYGRHRGTSSDRRVSWTTSKASQRVPPLPPVGSRLPRRAVAWRDFPVVFELNFLFFFHVSPHPISVWTNSTSASTRTGRCRPTTTPGWICTATSAARRTTRTPWSRFCLPAFSVPNYRSLETTQKQITHSYEKALKKKIINNTKKKVNRAYALRT